MTLPTNFQKSASNTKIIKIVRETVGTAGADRSQEKARDAWLPSKCDAAHLMFHSWELKSCERTISRGSSFNVRHDKRSEI